ncbi:RAQPRD family integrative conjugative element protein [Vibrio ostreicida]|uniref:RAQPRD family integrative conjugative element protein n=1 Tax=Vibrio ostreicida TaxID=526588 RepID=UPI003B5A3F00
MISPSTYANSSVEKEALIRIAQELQLMQEDIDALQVKHASTTMTQKFNYEALLSDINVIRTGIEQATNSNSREPKNLSPLKGKY